MIEGTTGIDESKRMKLSQSLEDYVRAIYELECASFEASVSRIADRLDVTAPSVTAAVQKLHELGIAIYKPYQTIKLTLYGESIAKMLTKKHRILVEFFQALGVEKEIADEDACHIEHRISDETFDKIGLLLRGIESGKLDLEVIKDEQTPE